MKRTLVLVLMVLAVASMALAQSPRKVLIQDFTGWSCIPCAQHFPVLRHYLADPQYASTVAVLSYHTDWQGYLDIMGMTNPACDFWFNRYAINMMPKYYFNGVPLSFNGEADTVAIQAYMDKLSGAISPITLTLATTRTKGHLHIHEEISTIQSLHGKMLRTEVGENYHYYAKTGLNGEHDFYWIARAMLPDTNSVALDLDSGIVKQFDLDYVIPDFVTDSALYAVAFVQNDTTHEVLQSATTNSMQLRAAQIPTFVMARQGSAQKSLELLNPNPTRANVTIDPDSNDDHFDPHWTVVCPRPFSIPANSSIAVPLTIQSPSYTSTGRVAFSIKTSFDALPPQTQIGRVNVRTDANSAFYRVVEDYYLGRDASNEFFLRNLSRFPQCDHLLSFSYPESRDTAMEFPPQDFPVSVMCVDDGIDCAYTNVDSSVSRIIAAGGRMLLMAPVENTGNIASMHSAPLVQLGVADTAAARCNQMEVVGLPGDIADGIDVTMSPRFTATGVIDEFRIAPGSLAKPILFDKTYEGQNIFCGLRAEFPNGARFVYVTPEIYTMSQPTADTLFVRLMQWLLAGTTSAEVKGTRSTESDIEIYPNPAQTQVRISAPTARNIRIRNLLGVTVAERRNAESWIWDCTATEGLALPKGAYFVEAEDQASGRVIMKPLLVTR